ncbi:hypothetical protein Tco_0959121 [Tanacetum coccineum]
MNPEGNRVVHDISKPLPLGGPPYQVTIQTQYFFNKDLEYLVSGGKEIRHALSISKLKAYRISHWWFKRKEFYITRHSAPSDRNAVGPHMRILSVVSLKTFSRYGYTYLKEIVLRKADYKEYKISEADFKNLHPNDFKDLDRNDQKKMIRENEVHKFSDGTLTRILEKLDYMVTDYELFKFNPGMENKIWTEDDKQRSQEFIKL